MISLDKVELNKMCVIKRLDFSDKALAHRLMELGLYQGVAIKIIKRSTFKKTLLVEFMHSIFALKTQTAEHIWVECI